MSIVDLTGRHAVTVSGATYNASGGPFNAGYYSLDGVDDFIRFADSQGDFVFGTGDYSVRFYAQVLPNREVADGSDIKVILDQGVSSGTGSWVVIVNQPKQVYAVEWFAPYNSPVGAWIKFEFSRVNGVCTNYVNDVPVYSAISPSNISRNSGFLDIGRYHIYYGKVNIAGLVIRKAGQVVLSALPVVAPATTATITSMEKDDGVPNDWLTSDGSAPRKVFGTISAILTPDEVVQVSCNCGVTWTEATVFGTSWEVSDETFHTTSWAIHAKVVDTSTLLSGPVASVQVTYTPPQPTVLPQGSYTTLLDIIRRFMERTGLPKPAFSIGSTDVQVTQVLGLLEEATEEIVMRNPRGWQILNRQAVFQTKAQEVQGSLSELAPGFRSVINDTLFNRTTRLPIYGPLLPMERQATKALQTAGPYYRYWIVNDELHFYPIPPAGQTIAFEYTSTAAWSDGKSPATYTEYPDSDTAICLFPKPVMIAQLRWRWKKEKGLDYAEDFAMAERLLNAAIAADGTRRVVDLGGAELVARPGIMIPTGSWPLK